MVRQRRLSFVAERVGLLYGPGGKRPCTPVNWKRPRIHANDAAKTYLASERLKLLRQSIRRNWVKGRKMPGVAIGRVCALLDLYGIEHAVALEEQVDFLSIVIAEERYGRSQTCIRIALVNLSEHMRLKEVPSLSPPSFVSRRYAKSILHKSGIPFQICEVLSLKSDGCGNV